MNSNKYKGILLATAMFAAMAHTGNSKGRAFDLDEDMSEPKKKPIPKGCKEYSFYGVTVVALNEASAIKKCKKKAGIV